MYVGVLSSSCALEASTKNTHTQRNTTHNNTTHKTKSNAGSFKKQTGAGLNGEKRKPITPAPWVDPLNTKVEWGIVARMTSSREVVTADLEISGDEQWTRAEYTGNQKALYGRDEDSAGESFDSAWSRRSRSCYDKKDNQLVSTYLPYGLFVFLWAHFKPHSSADDLHEFQPIACE